MTHWDILVFGTRDKRIPQLRTDMSGCQETLLLTRQATPAMPLQEVSYPLEISASFTSKENEVEGLLTLCSYVERKGSWIACCTSLRLLLRPGVTLQRRVEVSSVVCYLQVAATGSIHAGCPASRPQRSLSHTSLQSLQPIPEEQSEQQSFSRDGAAITSVQAQASVLLREKFPEQTQYIASSLRRRSPQGSCDLPTVYSGQLMTPVL